MSDFWNEFQGADEYVKFEEHGDSVTGTVVSVGVKDWDDGSRSPQVFVEVEDGTVKCVTASQVMLKKALAEAKPTPGDLLRVTYTGDGEKKPGRSAAKIFTVDVKRGDPPAASVGASAPANDDPFGV